VSKGTVRGNYVLVGNYQWRQAGRSFAVELGREGLDATVLGDAAMVEAPGLLRYGVSLDCYGRDDAGAAEQSLREASIVPWAIIEPSDATALPAQGDAAVWGYATRTEFEDMGEAGALRRFAVGLGGAAEPTAQPTDVLRTDRPWAGEVGQYRTGLNGDFELELVNTLVDSTPRWFGFCAVGAQAGSAEVTLQKSTDAPFTSPVQVGPSVLISGRAPGLLMWGPYTDAEMAGGFGHLRFRFDQQSGAVTITDAVSLQT
jgi:hypothetical protein